MSDPAKFDSEAPLEYQFCAYCRDHAEFERAEDGTWLSVCCGARPMPVDIEAPDL